MAMCRGVKHFVRGGDGSSPLAGVLGDGRANTEMPDHHLMLQGYITIVPHLVDNTAYRELERMRALGIDREFQNL